MAGRKPRRFLASLIQGLWWPTFWGISIATAVYFALGRGWFANPLWKRYLAGHWIEYVEVTMFCIGLSALILRIVELARQFDSTARVELEPAPVDGAPIATAAQLSEAISQFPPRVRTDWMAERLQRALDFVARQRSAERLDQELKFLAEEAENRVYEGLSLVRIIIWATPMLGFLGTVMGITLALGQLSPEALVSNPNQAMEGLLSALAVAFDTTALALIMSVILMFTMYLIGQSESELLKQIDDRAHSQLASRFQVTGTSRDPQLVLLRQLSQQVSDSTQKLVQRQAEIWSESFEVASRHWLGAAEGMRQQLENGVSQSLQTSLADHSHRLAQLHDHSEQRVERWWQELQTALLKNADMMERQQKELGRQGDVMARAIEATGEVVRLEHALNRNLKALAGSKNFEDTVMSLSAAIHLLSARVGHPPRSTDRKVVLSGDAHPLPDDPPIDSTTLLSPSVQGKAA